MRGEIIEVHRKNTPAETRFPDTAIEDATITTAGARVSEGVGAGSPIGCQYLIWGKPPDGKASQRTWNWENHMISAVQEGRAQRLAQN